MVAIYWFSKPTTSLNGPINVGPMFDRFREVLLYMHTVTHTHSNARIPHIPFHMRRLHMLFIHTTLTTTLNQPTTIPLSSTILLRSMFVFIIHLFSKNKFNILSAPRHCSSSLFTIQIFMKMVCEIILCR